jgi:two-component system response regulator MprA
MVLDVMMPYVGGLDVCRTLRSKNDRLPILVLTARDEVGDRVAGLDAGADDYLTKPFALEELRARLRALLRRTAVGEGDDAAALLYEDLELDPAAHTARRGDRPIDLTRTEFALLELLMRNAGRPLPRETIMDRVWGWESEPTSNSLEVFVGYLRRKTEASGEPRLIHTVRGVGYVLRGDG